MISDKVKKTTGFIIPAFNEEKSIASVLNDLRIIFPKTSALVVDDGSSDKTSEISSNLTPEVLTLVNNIGVGNALKLGFDYFEGLNKEIIVVLDADGQHSPKEVQKLIEVLISQNCDVVLGSRNFETYKLTKIERIAINLIKLLLRLRYGMQIKDPTSGMRAFKRRTCAQVLSKISDDFLDDTVGLVTIAKNLNLKIREVEVEMNYRQTGQASHNYSSKFMRTLGLTTRLLIGRKI